MAKKMQEEEYAKAKPKDSDSDDDLPDLEDPKEPEKPKLTAEEKNAAVVNTNLTLCCAYLNGLCAVSARDGLQGGREQRLQVWRQRSSDREVARRYRVPGAGEQPAPRTRVSRLGDHGAAEPQVDSWDDAEIAVADVRARGRA